MCYVRVVVDQYARACQPNSLKLTFARSEIRCLLPEGRATTAFFLASQIDPSVRGQGSARDGRNAYVKEREGEVGTLRVRVIVGQFPVLNFGAPPTWVCRCRGRIVCQVSRD